MDHEPSSAPHPPRVWITGAGGLIGNALVNAASRLAPQFQALGLTRKEADLEDFDTVRRLFQTQHPACVIHCAALSKSPDCQANPARARRINVDATALLAELAADIPFVFFSTDLVFDGAKGNYTESDPPNPLGVYAETKLAAERIVLANPRHTVLRTSLNGGVSPVGDRAFNEEMRRAWREGRTLDLFTDEFRCPLPAVVTARAVWELLLKNQPGLYHLAGAERLSRWQIGQIIAARCPELDPKMRPGSLRDYQGPPRSPDTSLNCAKVQELLSFLLPSLRTWLAANPEEPF
jgi:dTDP-4-dehydrorhamnose reductase